MIRLPVFIMTLLAMCCTLQPVARAEDPATTAAGIADPFAPDANEARAVVELFTSQGCSSCPPADAVMKEMATDPSLIALTFPVDYWDYLGWKDTFGSARNSARQRGYAKARGDGAIYTPQVVVNGRVHVNGAKRHEIDNAIVSTTDSFTKRRIPVRFWQERNTLNIVVPQAPPGRPNADATIWLGVVQSAATVDVKKGENAGEQLTYSNIVRDLTPIGLWRGKPMRIQIPRGAVMLAETERTVILLQEGRSGPIIGATWGNLW